MLIFKLDDCSLIFQDSILDSDLLNIRFTNVSSSQDQKGQKREFSCSLSSDSLTFDDLINISSKPPYFILNNNAGSFNSSSPIIKKSSKFIIDEEEDIDGNRKFLIKNSNFEVFQFLDLVAAEKYNSNTDNEDETDQNTQDSLDGFIVQTQFLEHDLYESDTDDNHKDSEPEKAHETLVGKKNISNFYRYSLQTQANPCFHTTKNSFAFQDGKYNFPSNFQIRNQSEYDQKYGTFCISSSENDYSF